MLLFPVGTSVLQERRRQVNLVHRDFPKAKGCKFFIEIRIHEFDNIKGRFTAEFFNGKRINMAEDCVEGILVNQSQLLEIAFLVKNITQFGMVVLQSALVMLIFT